MLQLVEEWVVHITVGIMLVGHLYLPKMAVPVAVWLETQMLLAAYQVQVLLDLLVKGMTEVHLLVQITVAHNGIQAVAVEPAAQALLVTAVAELFAHLVDLVFKTLFLELHITGPAAVAVVFGLEPTMV